VERLAVRTPSLCFSRRADALKKQRLVAALRWARDKECLGGFCAIMKS